MNSQNSRPGEFELIERYFAPLAGPGGLGLLDDAGLLRPGRGYEVVVTADALVAGVHFFPDDPPAAGRRSPSISRTSPPKGQSRRASS